MKSYLRFLKYGLFLVLLPLILFGLLVAAAMFLFFLSSDNPNHLPVEDGREIPNCESMPSQARHYDKTAPVHFTKEEVLLISKTIHAVARVVVEQKPLVYESDLPPFCFYFDQRVMKWKYERARFKLSIAEEDQAGGSISREKKGTAWHEGSIYIYNMMRSTTLNLSPQFYEDLNITFLKVDTTGEGPAAIHRFYYRPKNATDRGVRYVFSSDPRITDPKGGYPRSFFGMSIINEELKDKQMPPTGMTHNP